jgi:hypothetical protein
MDRQDIIRHRHLIDYLFNQQVKSYLHLNKWQDILFILFLIFFLLIK